MPFQKGKSGHPQGRKRGSRNRLTRDIKKAYLGAFNELGGEAGLIRWGRENPDAFYSQISKLLPKGIEIKSENDLVINIISAIPEPRPLPAKYAREALPSGDES